MTSETYNNLVSLRYAVIPIAIELVEKLEFNKNFSRQSMKNLLKRLKKELEKDELYFHDLINKQDEDSRKQIEDHMIYMEKALISFINAASQPNFDQLVDTVTQFRQGEVKFIDSNNNKLISKEDVEQAFKDVFKEKGVLSKDLVIEKLWK